MLAAGARALLQELSDPCKVAGDTAFLCRRDGACLHPFVEDVIYSPEAKGDLAQLRVTPPFGAGGRGGPG